MPEQVTPKPTISHRLQSAERRARKVNDARELLHEAFTIPMQADLNTIESIKDARETVANAITSVEALMDKAVRQ